MADPRPISPWWAAAVAPVAVAIGWVAGGMPVPGRPPQAAREPAPATTRVAASPIEPQVTLTRRVTLMASPSGDTGRAGSADSLAPPEPPSDPRTAAIFSEWTTFSNALAQARTTGKPVMLDFNADWCGPCQALKREVFESAACGTTVRAAVIPVSITDRMRELGSNLSETDELQRRFQVEAFPTLVVYSPATGRSVRLVGYAGETETLRWITESAASLRR